MTFSWPIVLRSTHERTLAATLREAADQRARDVRELADTHRAAILRLDEVHQIDLAAIRSVIPREVLRERTRCAEIARRTPAAARGQWVKDHILDGILNPSEGTTTTRTGSASTTTAST